MSLPLGFGNRCDAWVTEVTNVTLNCPLTPWLHVRKWQNVPQLVCADMQADMQIHRFALGLTQKKKQTKSKKFSIRMQIRYLAAVSANIFYFYTETHPNPHIRGGKKHTHTHMQAHKIPLCPLFSTPSHASIICPPGDLSVMRVEH